MRRPARLRRHLLAPCLTAGLLVALLALAPTAGAKRYAGPTGPVMVLSDGLDWGTGRDASGHRLAPGDRVTATVRIGNGIAGESGYSSSKPRRKPVMVGKTRTLGFSVASGTAGAAPIDVRLPFAFPFGGIRERTASVSPNGRISFGSPAWDRWGPSQAGDPRGAGRVVGDYERGIMPYWANLERGRRRGAALRMVTPADGDSVAFQWLAAKGRGARPAVQLVLFRDGRFRFDYPGGGAGGPSALIGYSLGTGAEGFHAYGLDVRSAPRRSILVTPRPLAATRATAAGEAVVELPSGRVLRSVPALKPGEEATRRVGFEVPEAARNPVLAAPRYAAAFDAGRSVLIDDDEVGRSARRRHRHPLSSFSVLPYYSSPSPPVAGEAAKFVVAVEESPERLNEAKVTFTPSANAAVETIHFTETFGCGPRFPVPASCVLPSGIENMGMWVIVIPSEAAIGSPITLGITVEGPDATSRSVTVSSPPVVP